MIDATEQIAALWRRGVPFGIVLDACREAERKFGGTAAGYWRASRSKADELNAMAERNRIRMERRPRAVVHCANCGNVQCAETCIDCKNCLSLDLVENPGGSIHPDRFDADGNLIRPALVNEGPGVHTAPGDSLITNGGEKRGRVFNPGRR